MTATKMDAVNALKELRGFIGNSQLGAVAEGMRSEEKQYFFDKAVELAATVSTMPKTYEQDGKGNQSIAYLHYFYGNMDWYITEKDMGSADDVEPGQHQAFGLADIGFGGELGYISITELIENGIELDFHFTPKTLEQIEAKRQEA